MIACAALGAPPAPRVRRFMYECPRGVAFDVWRSSVAELVASCPHPVGLYDDHELVVRPPDPGYRETK